MAKVTHCRQGETVAPVAGRTKEPIFGRVLDGEENARRVNHANVAEADLSSREKPATVRSISADRACISRVKAAQTVSSQEKSVQPRTANCRGADRELTLKSLFRSP